MRNYKVNGIKHIVYDVEKEVPSGINIVSDWRIAKLDDWVLTDDKCVIQILRKGTMVTKGGEKSYQNALKRSAKLREELKKQIKSIYNPKTGKFRSKEYKQMFEEGRYAKGDPRGVREKEGFANIGRRVNILGIETPFQSQQEIDLTSIQSYINELFRKDLASR